MGFKIKNLVKAVLNPAGAIITATAANNAADAAKSSGSDASNDTYTSSNKDIDDALARASAPVPPIITLTPEGLTTTSPEPVAPEAIEGPVTEQGNKTYGIIGLVVIAVAIIAIVIYYFKTK